MYISPSLMQPRKHTKQPIDFSEQSIIFKLPVKCALWFSVYNWQAAGCEYKQYHDVVLPNVFRPSIYREKGSLFDENMKKYNEHNCIWLNW